MAKHQYICIRSCVWHKPDFATPRYLEPDGGKTVYWLEDGAPPHIFRRIDLPAAQPQPVLRTSPVELGVPLHGPRTIFLELSTKDREELEKIAREIGLEDMAQFPDKINLTKEIMRRAGYLEPNAPAEQTAPVQPTPTRPEDLVLGSPEAEKNLAAEGQAIPVEKPDDEELDMAEAIQARADEPKPEPTPAAVELLNKSRKELVAMAEALGIENAGKLGNKQVLVEAILKKEGAGA